MHIFLIQIVCLSNILGQIFYIYHPNCGFSFIGQLYLQQLISVRIILFCVVDLLKSVTEKPENLDGYEAVSAQLFRK